MEEKEMNQEKFNMFVKQFQEKRDKNNLALHMHSFSIQQGGERYIHHFKNAPEMSDVRSISKTVLTLVTGIVIRLAKDGQYKDFTEETYIYPILKDLIEIKSEQQLQSFKQIQIKHLLTHTVGYDDVLLMRQDIAHVDPYSYVDLLANHPLIHPPGKYYLYSNAGFYLLSAVLQTFLGEELESFIQRELFRPLGIKNFIWEKYGNYLAGATRLWLAAEDLLKIGELILQRGSFNDQQMITEEWLGQMRSTHILTSKVDTPKRIFRRYAYGYGIWLAKDNNIFFGHGTDGQILVIAPEKELIIITQAEQKDMEPIEDIINEILVDENIS